MTDVELQALLREANNHCEPAAHLRRVLDLLVQADLHEERDESDEDTYASIKEAEADLFTLATEWDRLKREEEG